MVEAYRPGSLKEALKMLESGEAMVFAGGTDLMVKYRAWSGLEPDFKRKVVFISDLKELKEIRKYDGYLSIGTCCTFSNLINSLIIPDYIKEICSYIASPAIRNVATIGGNICNASPAGDILPLLYASDAALVLEKSMSNREVKIDEFIKGPGRTDIKTDEILKEIKIPVNSFNISAFRKVGTRKSIALSKVSFMGLAEKEGGELKDVHIAFGAVGPRVVRDKGLEDMIIYMYSTGNLDIVKIKESYKKIITPIDDQRSTAHYRMEVALGLLEDFLKHVNT